MFHIYLYPRFLSLGIPDIFSGGPLCLFEHCASLELGLPTRIFLIRKKHVLVSEDGWVAEYEDGVEVHERVPLSSGLTPGADLNVERSRSQAAAARAEARELREAFGEIGLGDGSGEESTDSQEVSEVEPYNENDFVLGKKPAFSENDEFTDGRRSRRDQPHDELVQRIRAPDDDRYVMLGKLTDSIDFGRYVPTVDLDIVPTHLTYKLECRNKMILRFFEEQYTPFELMGAIAMSANYTATTSKKNIALGLYG